MLLKSLIKFGFGIDQAPKIFNVVDSAHKTLRLLLKISNWNKTNITH